MRVDGVDATLITVYTARSISYADLSARLTEQRTTARNDPRKKALERVSIEMFGFDEEEREYLTTQLYDRATVR